MEEVKGYKAFNYDSTNRYGMPFTEGATYRVEGDISFGNNGNGYHMCTALSDVFRYVNATEEAVLVARVTGSGDFVKVDDNYYGYYDMYSVREITIDKFLNRDEVIELMLKSNSFQVRKFLMTCKLTEDEALKFARKFRNDADVIKTLLYYHFGYPEIYKTTRDVNEYLRLVLENGQDSNKRSKGK